MAGSDWSSSGGWAIVLITSSAVRNRFAPPEFVSGALYQGYIELASPRREKTQLTDSSSGLAGFVTYYSDGRTIGSVIIDRNKRWPN